MILVVCFPFAFTYSVLEDKNLYTLSKRPTLLGSMKKSRMVTVVRNHLFRIQILAGNEHLHWVESERPARVK